MFVDRVAVVASPVFVVRLAVLVASGVVNATVVGLDIQVSTWVFGAGAFKVHAFVMSVASVIALLILLTLSAFA